MQHLYNSWNKLCGYVTATPGRGYKEIVSQDGMYTGHAEEVAICEVKCYSLNYNVIKKRGKPETTYGSGNCLRTLFHYLFYFLPYRVHVLWAVFVIFYYKVTACKIIRMYEVFVANLSKVC